MKQWLCQISAFQLICPPLYEYRAKHRSSHIFFNRDPKLSCNISFLSYTPALPKRHDHTTIPCNRTKIQKTPIFSTVVDKLIGTLKFVIAIASRFGLLLSSQTCWQLNSSVCVTRRLRRFQRYA